MMFLPSDSQKKHASETVVCICNILVPETSPNVDISGNVKQVMAPLEAGKFAILNPYTHSILQPLITHRSLP
ncbi:hypothetical protein VTL71DRAFT_12675 [Oculimacula yallundae]|uniref:Uncharacterized protein n=1 Tax=Oculimacula yallundae TaxID=86028 RepID=A0ABR4CNQ1_9HELO